MAEIKLVVTDLDGTYLDQGRVLPENEAQVRRVQRLGVRVMACTGRTWTMCDWLIPQLGFDEYAVTSNGASIVEGRSGRVWHRQRLNPDFLRPLAEAALEANVPFDVYCGPHIHTFAPLRSVWTQNHQRRAATTPPEQRIRFVDFDDLDSWEAGTRDVAELFRVEVGPNQPFPEPLRRAMQRHGMGENVTMSFQDHWDICDPEATKENAIARVCAHFGIARQEVLALGDSLNDAGMLEWAGVGVAMGNASPHAKQAADYVSAPCAQGGFAKALQRFVGGEA